LNSFEPLPASPRPRLGSSVFLITLPLRYGFFWTQLALRFCPKMLIRSRSLWTFFRRPLISSSARRTVPLKISREWSSRFRAPIFRNAPSDLLVRLPTIPAENSPPARYTVELLLVQSKASPCDPSPVPPLSLPLFPFPPPSLIRKDLIFVRVGFSSPLPDFKNSTLLVGFSTGFHFH